MNHYKQRILFLEESRLKLITDAIVLRFALEKAQKELARVKMKLRKVKK